PAFRHKGIAISTSSASTAPSLARRMFGPPVKTRSHWTRERNPWRSLCLDQLQYRIASASKPAAHIQALDALQGGWLRAGPSVTHQALDALQGGWLRAGPPVPSAGLWR